MKPLALSFLLLAAVISASCRQATSDEAPATAAPSRGGAAEIEFPPPVKPEWLTNADFERLTKGFDNDSDEMDDFVSNLDVFVVTTMRFKERARSEAVAGCALVAKSYLHRLYYDVSFDKAVHPADDPAFYTALATFERRAGLNVDGTFTLGEFAQLAFLAGLEGEPEVMTGLKLVAGGDRNAWAKGTWVAQGDTLISPVNRSEIDCRRADRTCTVFTANVELPGGRKHDRTRPLLTTRVETYDILAWDTTEVRARAAAGCRQTILTLDWATHQARTVTTDIEKEGCPGTGSPKTSAVTTLEGHDPIEAFFEKRQERLNGVSNSPRERLRSFLSTLP
jgi:hypothetical protein